MTLLSLQGKETSTTLLRKQLVASLLANALGRLTAGPGVRLCIILAEKMSMGSDPIG